MERAYLGLGSNLGERATNLQAAIRRLDAAEGVRVARQSAVYETEPIGYTDQPWFLNAVAEVETTLEPRQLLELAKAIERELGRQEGPRWGPRAIDVDILLFGERSIREPDLVVPHRELWNRLFVLGPLAELRPDLKHDGRPIAERAAKLARSQMVRRLEQSASRTGGGSAPGV